MVKRKLLAMLMAAAVFFTVGISSSMNVQATENDESVAPVTTFENFEKEEIEIPTVEVPEITYNAEGNKKCEQTFFFEGIQTLDTNDEEDNTDPNNTCYQGLFRQQKDIMRLWNWKKKRIMERKRIYVQMI